MNVKFRENVFDVVIHSGRADVETQTALAHNSQPAEARASSQLSISGGNRRIEGSEPRLRERLQGAAKSDIRLPTFIEILQ
jgi:hypothetical protein